MSEQKHLPEAINLEEEGGRFSKQKVFPRAGLAEGSEGQGTPKNTHLIEYGCNIMEVS